MPKGDLYVLLEPGAHNPDDGDFYGAKGQLVMVTGNKTDSIIKILSPKADQMQSEFYTMKKKEKL